jgi:hypothetical protein
VGFDRVSFPIALDDNGAEYMSVFPASGGAFQCSLDDGEAGTSPLPDVVGLTRSQQPLVKWDTDGFSFLFQCPGEFTSFLAC